MWKMFSSVPHIISKHCKAIQFTIRHRSLWIFLPIVQNVRESSERVPRPHLQLSNLKQSQIRQKRKYQGVKEFHMLARVGCCNIMVFSPFKVKVTYYHPLNLWLLGATSGNQGQTVMCLQCSETIKICLKLQIPYYHPLNLWLLGATNGNQGQTVMHL